MNLSNEIAWIESKLAESKCPPLEGVGGGFVRADMKILGKLLEVCIKAQSTGFKRKKRDKVVYESYKEFIAAYSEFIRAQQGVGVLIDSYQGAALKKIIAFLIENSKDKNELGEQGALAAWKYILGSWNRLTPFLKQQVALFSIYKNLPEILQVLRNGTFKKQTSANKQDLADLKSR